MPDEQHVAPVHCWPPHCPQRAAQPVEGGGVEPDPGEAVVVAGVVDPPPVAVLILLLMKVSACWPYSAP